MGPVNWLAVVVAGVAAAATVLMPNAAGSASERPAKRLFVPVLIVMLIAAAMLGHSLARIGAETLGAKPWLYFMQSGGLALAFVMPAVWLTHAGRGVPVRARLADCGAWLAAYLAMGAVFWALA